MSPVIIDDSCCNTRQQLDPNSSAAGIQGRTAGWAPFIRTSTVRDLYTCWWIPSALHPVSAPMANFMLISCFCPSTLFYCFWSQVLNLHLHRVKNHCLLHVAAKQMCLKKEINNLLLKVCWALGQNSALCFLLMDFSSQSVQGSQLKIKLELERNQLDRLSWTACPLDQTKDEDEGQGQPEDCSRSKQQLSPLAQQLSRPCSEKNVGKKVPRSRY